MYCPHCGTSNADDATFCQSCGKSLKESSGGPTAGGSPPTPPPSYSYSGPTGGKTASYKMSSAFSDAIALVRSPASFMNANKENDVSVNTLMINYVAVLAAVPFIATLIGRLWFYGLFFGALSIGYVFVLSILTYVLDIVAVFVVGYIIWKIAPNFGTSTTQVRATRTAAYVFTPAFLISILNIIPFLGFLAFLGLLYGLYIMYIGFPILTNTPKDKVLGYVIVTVVLTIVVYAVIGAIIGAVAAAWVIGTFGFF